MNTGPVDEREQRMERALAACLQAVESGRAADLCEALGGHAEFAAEVAEFFFARVRVENVTSYLRLLTSSAPAAFGAGPERTVTYEATAGTSSEEGDRRSSFGDYQLQELIGSGGMGVVYRAWQRSLDRPVALKMLRAGARSSPESLRQLRAEAEAIARLDHAHIVPVYEVGQHAGEPFFSMRLMQGGSLAQRLASAPLPNREAARVLGLLSRATHYAHSHGIIHRDLKPSNVLFDTAGQPCLADFGLAKHLRPDPQASASAGAVVGTAGYMAPEQTTSGRAPTALIDVYGLGAILYEMLAGRPPFKAATFDETLRQVRETPPARPGLLNPQVAPVLEAICLMCLEKTPADRYESASDLADDLDHYLAGRTTRAEGRSGRMGRILRGMARYPDSRPEALRTWGAISLWFGLLIVLFHIGYFALIRIEAGPLLFLCTDALNWVLLILVFWWHLGRRGRPLGPRERQIVGLSQIEILGFVAMAWASLPRALADPATHRLMLYPAFMINIGLLYLFQGRLWAGFYLIGGLSLVMAFGLGFWPEAGPLTYAAVHGACSISFGLFLTFQARRAARSGQPGAAPG